MTTMKTRLASGAASAHLYDLAPSTTVFKTRNMPCRIAVRAEIKKLLHSMKTQTHLGAIWTSFGADSYRIQSFDHPDLRCTENRSLKTDDSQRRCDLRFPYGTSRSSSNGLLEQMP